MKIGDKLKSQCVSCDCDEIWEIESIDENVEYLDGLFRKYNLKSVQNCFPSEIRTSVKDTPEALSFFEVLK